MKIKPPKYAEKILRFFLPKRDREFLLGDFDYLYQEVFEKRGNLVAVLWYWFIVVKAIPLFVNNQIYWGVDMFANFVKIVLRNIRKQKLYSFITISGLALGLGVFILFWLITEISFSADEFHKNSDRIYGVVQEINTGSGEDFKTAITPAPMLGALKLDISGIEDGVRFYPAGKSIISYNGNSFYENQVLFVDNNFLNFFSFDIKLGNPETMLMENNSVVLTEEMVHKYFGVENPIGKIISLNKNMELKVTGIVENSPITSSINYSFLIPINTSEKMAKWRDDWSENTQATFILLKEGVEPFQLKDDLNSFIAKYYPASPNTPENISLLLITDFLFGTMGINTYLDKNFPIVNYLLLASAIVLLVIVCINFMSLATAKYTGRAKEVGIRKVIGAGRGSLVYQFLGESVLLSILSIPLAVLVYEAGFIFLSGQWWTASFISLYDNPMKLVMVVVVAIVVGLIAGSYPAFFLSSFRPVKVLKGLSGHGKKGAKFRKSLVVAQFTMAIILIVFAAVINKQFNHILEADFGYTRDHVIGVSLPPEAQSKVDLIKNRLANFSEFEHISSSAYLPCQWNPEIQIVPQGYSKEESFTVNNYGIDYDFVELFGMEMVEGRSLSRVHSDDNSFVINETAAARFQWDEPIGKEIAMGDIRGRVVGVVKDYLFKDMHVPISPSLMYIEKNSVSYLLVKTNPSIDTHSAVALIKDVWDEHLPDSPFESITLDQHFQDIYYGFNTIGTICGVVGIIGIFLSCMGMLALSTFAVEKRKKEIGVRKVLGASEVGLIKLLVIDFMKWVVISNIIGLTISYYVINEFLDWVTTYRVDIGAPILILTMLGSLFVALFSVAWQTLRAASANPIDSLKYE